jgi:hypothetical protein
MSPASRIALYARVAQGCKLWPSGSQERAFTATTMPPAKHSSSRILLQRASCNIRCGGVVGGRCARRQPALLQGTLSYTEFRPRSAAGARCLSARVLAPAPETRWAAPRQYLGARKKSEHVLCAQRWRRGGDKRTQRQYQSEPSLNSLSLCLDRHGAHTRSPYRTFLYAEIELGMRTTMIYFLGR